MNASEKLIRDIVAQVLQQTTGVCADGFVKKVDPSGILMVQTSTVKCEPFEQKGVSLKDVATLEEAPRMGCGVMELEPNTSFEWTLTYDEWDYVIDGQLDIEIDGRIVRGNKGDLILIPKGSHIHFQSTPGTRYVYFVYPANWSSQD